MTTTPPTEQPRWTEYRPLDEVARAPRNAKRHDEENLAASLARFGYVEQITVDERTGRLVAGHGRLDALIARRDRGEDPPDGVTVDSDGVWAVPVARGWRSATDAEAAAYLIESNQSVMLPGWDPVGLSEMLDEIGRTDPSLLVPAGFPPEVLARFLDGLPDGDGGGGGGGRLSTPTLADRFGVPPFDVIDARTGWWRDRKAQWLALGIRSEIGRSGAKPGGGEAGQGKDAYLTAQGNTGPDAANGRGRRGLRKRRETRPDAHILRSDSGRDSDYYRRKQDVEARLGRTLTTEEFQEHYYAAPTGGNGGISDSGTSVFDPVLCELVYRWFSPAGGLVLDPFAGGSVRGVVAGVLGRRYAGLDLSAEQVLANETQVETIVPVPEHEEPVTVPVTVPDWQRGYDLDDLRAVTRLFAEHDAGLVLGGYTGIREVDVATAAADGTLLVRADADGPAAAVITRTLTKRQTVEDFAGYRSRLNPGDVLVTRLGCRDGHAGTLLSLLAALAVNAGEGRLAVEGWTEHPVDRAVVAALGLAPGPVKVRASSEIRTVYGASDEPYAHPAAEAATLTRLPLDLTEQAAALLAEVRAHPDLAYADHYSTYNTGHSWSAAALRGYGGRTDFIIKPSEMSKGWKAEHPDECSWDLADTPLRAALPAVEPILDAVGGTVHRVRLMRLAPGGGELTRHADITDPDAGVADGRVARLHLPLVTNPGVTFGAWLLDGRRVMTRMPVGQVTYLDTRKAHTAANDGTEERLHLVIDVESDERLRDLIAGGAGPAVEYDPADDAGAVDLTSSPPTDPWEPRAAATSVEVPPTGRVVYRVGDARDLLPTCPDGTADLLFTCPPYLWLERYSEDPRDLSTMTRDGFTEAYAAVLAEAYRVLRDDSFAVLIVGCVRDSDGRQHDLRALTVDVAERAGFTLRNVAVLITPVGSLAVRAPRQFTATRVLGRGYQDVVVLVKGSANRAAERCGKVSTEDLLAAISASTGEQAEE